MGMKQRNGLLAVFLSLLTLGLGACSGMAPSGATHERLVGGGSEEGGSSIVSIAEPNNTPMPTGHVAPTPDPHCEGEDCLKTWHWEVKAEVQCRLLQLEGEPYKVRYSGYFQADDGTIYTGTGHTLRIVNEDVPLPQYLDTSLKEGGIFSVVMETLEPLKTTIFEGGLPDSPILPKKEKDCPDFECVEGPKFQKWETRISLEMSENVLPCLSEVVSTPAPASSVILDLKN